MKISLLKTKYCLGTKELDLNPGQITIIEGEEGKGKTSILESIQRFFYPNTERSVFVNSEGERAEIYLDLDDGTTMKKYINKENKVTTTSIEKDGMSPKSPETFIKSLVSERQLNPISLVHMNDKELTALILSLIPIKVTEDDLKEWLLEVPAFVDCTKHGLQVCKDVEQAYFAKRTDLNRKVKDLTSEVKSLKEKLPEEYNVDEWREVSLQEKYEAISKANIINDNINRAKVVLDKSESDINKVKEITAIEIGNLQKQIKELQDKQQIQIDEIKFKTTAAKEYIEKIKIIDIAPLEVAHKEAEEMKSYIRTADDLKAKEAELLNKESESEGLTKKIEYMRTKPQMLLAKAEMPIEGITVDGQGNVLINDRPIISLSGGERIKFVMAIVRATAGPLKIILIDGFEKLSSKGQKEFIDECSGDDFQYIITKVTDGDLKIKVIKDGNTIDHETGEIL